MKKKVLGLALIAMSVVSFGAMAQNNTTTDNAKKECVNGKKGDKQCRANKPNPFEGLNLTADQQTKLQQLNESRRAARQEQAKQRKENRQKNDSTRMAQRRADKKAYLDQVKAIVGPQEYVVFLENFYVNGPAQKNGAKAGMNKGKKSGKNQGDRKDRGNQAFNRGGDRANTQAAAPQS